MKKMVVSLLLVFLVTTIFAATKVIRDEEYLVLDTEDVTVMWDPVIHTDLDHYELQLVWMETDQIYPLGNIDKSSTQITFTCPRTGHFLVKCRACPAPNNPDYPNCSDWAISNNGGGMLMNGTPGDWIIYSRITPPSWGSLTF